MLRCGCVDSNGKNDLFGVAAGFSIIRKWLSPGRHTGFEVRVHLAVYP